MSHGLQIDVLASLVYRVFIQTDAQSFPRPSLMVFTHVHETYVNTLRQFHIKYMCVCVFWMGKPLCCLFHIRISKYFGCTELR